MPIITPVLPVSGKPEQTQTIATSPYSSDSAKSARERAIAKLMGPAASPVQNATQVAPEELAVVKSPEGQISANEEPSEVTQAPAKTEESPISSQYAVLARKEKAFRQKVAAEQATLKAERLALEKAKAEIAAKDAEYQSKYIPKERLTEDTVNVLLESGISYDQITQMMLNQSTAHQDPVLKSQLAEIKAQIKAQQDTIEEAKRAQQAAQDQQYQEALSQISREASQLVNSDPAFEAIRETKSTKDVVDLIEKTFKEDGVLLSVEEAAQEVESHLIEQLSKYAQKIKKLQQKTQPQTAKPAASAPQQSVASKPQSSAKTLTNSMGASKPLSARERAILAFENKLGK